MNKVIFTIVFVILLTLIFKKIPNKSNIKKKYIIPVIVLCLTKYIIGDWDKGSKWSYSDILYVILILFLSFLIIIFDVSKKS